MPVCSPHLLKFGKRLKEPRDLLNHTLVHIEWSQNGMTWPNWRMWMKAAGIEDFDDRNTIVFENSAEAVDAAMAGNAVALADFAMVANDLSEGRLVQPFELSLKVSSDFAYHLVYPEKNSDDRRIAAFRDWLLEEVRRQDDGKLF